VVNKEVEQQFSGRGVTCNEEPAFLLLNNLGKAAELHLAFSLCSAAGLCHISAYRLFDINILGKAASLHLTLALFFGWGCTTQCSAYRTLSTIVLMSS
jgi:hypothetical protein